MIVYAADEMNTMLCNTFEWQQLKEEWYQRRTAFLQARDLPIRLDPASFQYSQAEAWTRYTRFHNTMDQFQSYKEVSMKEFLKEYKRQLSQPIQPVKMKRVKEKRYRYSSFAFKPIEINV